jgi:ribonuclease HI
VVTAMQKRYSHGYGDDLTALLAVTDRFKLIFPKWVPEKETHQAHALAQQALQRQRKK